MYTPRNRDARLDGWLASDLLAWSGSSKWERNRLRLPREAVRQRSVGRGSVPVLPTLMSGATSRWRRRADPGGTNICPDCLGEFPAG